MLEKHQSGQRDFAAPLWSLLMFDAFLKNAEQTSGR
jgi:asparagine synthase (glutamine-hydrolysing)